MEVHALEKVEHSVELVQLTRQPFALFNNHELSERTRNRRPVPIHSQRFGQKGVSPASNGAPALPPAGRRTHHPRSGWLRPPTPRRPPGPPLATPPPRGWPRRPPGC